MKPKEVYAQHLNQWSDVQDHLPFFREHARGTILEIGVRAGLSTSAFLSGIEDNGGHLWSIDIEDCSQVFAGHHQWAFLRADSCAEKETLLDTLPKEFDILFVDGDHTKEGASSDLFTYGPRAKKIFVHDTDAPNFPGVRAAVLDYVKASGRALIFRSGSFGLAVIE